MKTDKTLRQFHKDLSRSSAIRRLILASLMVMGFFAIFWDRNVVRGFSYTPLDAHITFVCQKAEDVKNNKYHICINSETANAPAPDKDMITIDDEGRGEFLIHITEPGNYDYLLYQRKDSDKEIKYDEVKYEVHVFVTSDENGVLAHTVSVNLADTATKPKTVTFKNTSTRESKDPKPQPPTTESPKIVTSTPAPPTAEAGQVIPPTETPVTVEPVTEEPDTEEPDEDDEEDDEDEEVEQPAEEKPDGRETGRKNARTGDTSNILLAVFLMIASFSAIIAIVLKKKLKDS